MTEEFQLNVSAAAAAASSTILNDLGKLSGINPAYAQTFPLILGAYMNAKAANGGTGNPLDSYAFGVVGGLAALLTSDTRQGAACFEDIAAWALGGAAHCRTALAAEQRAQAAEDAAGVAQAKQADEMAAAAAPKARAPRPAPANQTATQVAAPMPPATALTNGDPAPDLAALGKAGLQAHGVIPQDPREAAPAAYAGPTPASEYGATGFDSDGRAEG